MFIELVDALRCPTPHEESWLVASADRMEARHIVTGTLGCPVCRAEYPIREGVVDFRRGAAGSSPLPPAAEPDPEQALRLAAFLDLTDASGFAVLVGAWGAHAPLLRAEVETPLMLVDPPANIVGEPGISVLRCDGELPLAAGAARGVAIDGGPPARVTSAVRATRTAGRVLAPASVALPEGVREIARSEALWVGEREAAVSPLVTLHVRRGVPG
jgi:uncharacterized protein YbaR (Trm112 family)